MKLAGLQTSRSNLSKTGKLPTARARVYLNDELCCTAVRSPHNQLRRSRVLTPHSRIVPQAPVTRYPWQHCKNHLLRTSLYGHGCEIYTWYILFFGIHLRYRLTHLLCKNLLLTKIWDKPLVDLDLGCSTILPGQWVATLAAQQLPELS